MKNKTYRETIAAEVEKSYQQKDAARYLYYSQAYWTTVACAPFEFFKGSWAGQLWLKKHQAKIEEIAERWRYYPRRR